MAEFCHFPDVAMARTSCYCSSSLDSNRDGFDNDLDHDCDNSPSNLARVGHILHHDLDGNPDRSANGVDDDSNGNPDGDYNHQHDYHNGINYDSSGLDSNLDRDSDCGINGVECHFFGCF